MIPYLPQKYKCFFLEDTKTVSIDKHDDSSPIKIVQ